MTDKPIEPQEFTHGVKVVQIEDLRIARGLTRRPKSACRHKSLVFDDKERRVWCEDCESEVDAFDAFKGLCEVWDRGMKGLQRQLREVEEAKQLQLRSRAAKALDKVWRGRRSVPLCPHCRSALLPEDVANGLATTSRTFAEAQRKKREKPD